MEDFYGSKRAYAREETGDGCAVALLRLHCKRSSVFVFSPPQSSAFLYSSISKIVYRTLAFTVGSPPNTSTSARGCGVPLYSWMEVNY
jgi:hypothetical protein